MGGVGECRDAAEPEGRRAEELAGVAGGDAGARLAALPGGAGAVAGAAAGGVGVGVDAAVVAARLAGAAEGEVGDPADDAAHDGRVEVAARERGEQAEGVEEGPKHRVGRGAPAMLSRRVFRGTFGAARAAGAPHTNGVEIGVGGRSWGRWFLTVVRCTPHGLAVLAGSLVPPE